MKKELVSSFLLAGLKLKLGNFTLVGTYNVNDLTNKNG